MSSGAEEDAAVDVRMLEDAAEHNEEEENVVDVDDAEEEGKEQEDQEVVEVDGEEQKHEENEEDEVQFMGSIEGTNDQQYSKSEEEDVVVVETGETSPHQRSTANTNALLASNGFVTFATLEAELQCIICQYAMFKPVSAICGHSFCRVCLMESILTRPIEEAQCPICRVEILQPFSSKSSLESIFSINVTLWNLAQLLIPSITERISSYQEEEEADFKHKLDQLNTKWKLLTLSERAARYHGDHDEEDELSGRTGSSRWEEDHEGHEEYPVLKVDDTDDGNLHLSRNVVLDTNDENEDGLLSMRVGLAIVEFPSVFELYNEHQECSVNVIKMEEDEEMADGMPFFMNDDGDDDGFVCSSYYNEISLRVCDEAGNCVMERTRGAQGGVVTFPGLRLDVPGGVYTFRFEDDLYGLKLSITTRLREPHEISDTPVADYVTLIHDEARDASHRNRGRGPDDSDDEGEYEEDGNESDDSFIVDDLNGEIHEEEPEGHFSDEEGHWEHSDDEAADERREQRRIRRRQRSGRRSDRDVQFVEEQPEEEQLSGEEGEHDDFNEPDDADEHEDELEVHPGGRNVRVVEEAAFSSDEEDGDDAHESMADAADDDEEEHREIGEVSRARRRNANQIVDSEDEDDGASTGLNEEQKEEDVSDAVQHEHTENTVDNEEGVDVTEDVDEDDAVEHPSRKLKRSQWFQEQEEESEEEDEPSELEAAFLPDDDGEAQRPSKRTRGLDRQVRIVDDGESDEEQELMEQSIAVANSMHSHEEDEEEVEEDADRSQFGHVHQFDDEEVNQDDNADYPDEDEAQNDDYAEYSE